MKYLAEVIIDLDNGGKPDLRKWARQWVTANAATYSRRQHLTAVSVYDSIGGAFRSMGLPTHALPHEAIASEHMARAKSMPVAPAQEWPEAAQVKLLRDIGSSR